MSIKTLFNVPNKFRVREGKFSSTDDFGNNGAFHFNDKGYEFWVIASDGGGWDHVSVSINRNRTPSWEQMCFVKEMFWDPFVTVVQFHPRADEYVNCAPNCLHLWRNQNYIHELPPSIFVGPKEK